MSPVAAPADAEAAFGVHISFAVPGLFCVGCLFVGLQFTSVAANRPLANFFLLPFPSVTALQGTMGLREMQIISLYQPQCSEMQQCSHLPNSLC